MTVALVRYDAARQALAEASRVDEVKEIHDQATALLAYARQRDDVEMAQWVAEIRLRAEMRIGELSRDLEKAPPGPPAKKIPSGAPRYLSKTDTLKAAGITLDQASRAERIAEPKARKAVEQYLAEQIEKKKAPTLEGALRVAQQVTRPPKPPRPAGESYRRAKAYLKALYAFEKAAQRAETWAGQDDGFPLQSCREIQAIHARLGAVLERIDALVQKCITF